MVAVNPSQANPDSSGGGISKKGRYHFLVEKTEDFSQAADRPRLEVHLMVLNGDHADQIGKKIRETFWLSEKAWGRLLTFACAIGLYTKQQWRADKEANIARDIPIESQSEGRTFVAPIDMREYSGSDPEKAKQYEGRLFPNFSFEFWAVGDEKADTVPKDADYLSLFGPPGCPLPTSEGPPRIPGTKATGGDAVNRPAAPPSRPAAPAAPVNHAAAPPAASGFGNF